MSAYLKEQVRSLPATRKKGVKRKLEKCIRSGANVIGSYIPPTKEQRKKCSEPESGTKKGGSPKGILAQ